MKPIIRNAELPAANPKFAAWYGEERIVAPYLRDIDRKVRAEMRDRLKRLMNREIKQALRVNPNRGCLMSNTRAPGVPSLHWELTVGAV